MSAVSANPKIRLSIGLAQSTKSNTYSQRYVNTYFLKKNNNKKTKKTKKKKKKKTVSTVSDKLNGLDTELTSRQYILPQKKKKKKKEKKKSVHSQQQT